MYQIVYMYLRGDTNDTAGRTGTCVTSLLGLLVAAAAEVVGAGVDDDGALGCVRSCLYQDGWGGDRDGGEWDVKKYMGTYADNAVRTNQLDQLISHAALGITLGIGLEVAQVTDVALLILGCAVGLVVGVDYAR